MKAALLKEFGKPLVLAEVPTPEPGPGQVLIRVAACGACHSDVHVAQGEWEGFKARMPMPVILGHEVAGTVLRTGEGVHRLREGDAVGVPWFYYTCGECLYCRQDQEVFCDRSQVTGVTVHGGFAEFMVAWENHVVPIPSTLKLELAAPLFCAGGTVFSALAKVKLDNSVRLRRLGGRRSWSLWDSAWVRMAGRTSRLWTSIRENSMPQRNLAPMSR